MSSKPRVGSRCRPTIKRHECTSTAAAMQPSTTTTTSSKLAFPGLPSLTLKSWCSGKLEPNPCRPVSLFSLHAELPLAWRFASAASVLS